MRIERAKAWVVPMTLYLLIITLLLLDFGIYMETTAFVFLGALIVALPYFAERKAVQLERTYRNRLEELVEEHTAKLEGEITNRKLAQDALRESEELYRQVADHIREWIWEMDANGLYTYASPIVEKVLGYEPEEIVDEKHFYDLFHPEDREELRRAVFEVFAEKQSLQKFVSRSFKKNGETIWISTSGIPVVDGKGALLGYRGSNIDITERKEIEHLNVVLRAVRNVIQLTTKEKDPHRLLEGVCQHLVEVHGFNSAWIVLLDELEVFVMSSAAGLGKDYFSLVERLRQGDLPHCCRKALKELGVVEVQDILSTCDHCPLAPMSGHRNAMSTRLEWAGKVYGVLVVSVPSDITIDEEDRFLFFEVTNDIAFALNNIEVEEKRKQAEERVQRLLKQQIVVNSLALALGDLTDLDGIYLTLHKYLSELIDVAGLIVYSYDEDTQLIRVEHITSLGTVQDITKIPSIPLGDGPQSQVIRTGKPLYLPDFRKAMEKTSTEYTVRADYVEGPPLSERSEPHTNSAISVPMKIEGKIVGVMQVQSYQLNAYTQEDIILLSGLANVAAIVLKKAYFYDQGQKEIAERKRAQYYLIERMKELNCIYGVTKIAERQDLTLSEIMHLIVQLVPPSWQYPEITGGRIAFDGQHFVTPRFQEDPWIQSADIRVDGQKVGAVAVSYAEKRPDMVGGEGPFLREERLLIDAIAERLGRTIKLRRAEKALQESEEKHRELIEKMQEGVLSEDTEGIITFVNPQAARMLAYSEEELIGQLRSIFVPGVKGVKIREESPKLSSGIGSTYESTLLRKDGETFPVLINATLLFSATEEFRGVLSVFTDITELRRTEKALRQSTIELRQLIETANAPIIGVDFLGHINEWNEKTTEITGFSKEEAIGQNLVEEFVPADYRTSIKQVLDKALVGQETVNFDFQLYSKYKRQVDILFNATTRRDDKGDITGVIGIGQDITERKRSEEALARSRDSLVEKVAERTRDLLEEKQRIETIVETIPDGILVLDPEGSLSLANRTFKDLYQRIFQEQLPDHLNINEQPSSCIFEAIIHLITSEDSEPVTIEPIEGSHLQVFSSDIEIPGEEPLGIIIEFRDVSSFVEFDKLRKQFVSTVSHELRTPIAAISLSISNLQKYREKLSETQQAEIIDMIAKSSSILNQMVGDLLIISRVEAGTLKLQWTAYSLWEILNAVSTQLDPNRQVKEITLLLDVSPDIQLIGDTQRISQIFRILLDNAIKYSDERSQIKIEAIDRYQGKYNPEGVDGTLIRVVDSGRGIRVKDLPHVFDRFYRSDDVKEIEGTGLGLAIAKEMVLLHHGEIYADSEYGRGSTFSVFLSRMEESPSK